MTEARIPRLPAEAFPQYVVTEGQRERWQLAHAIATKISADNEPGGVPNSRFVWYFTRDAYNSDIPTDETPAARDS